MFPFHKRSAGNGNNVAAPVAAPSLRWSDPATWGGSLPSVNDAVVIPAGQSFILDTTAAVCASLDVQGTLVADPLVDVGMSTGYINIGSAGTLQIGAVGTPYTRKAAFTFSGLEANRVQRFVADVVVPTTTGNGRLKKLWALDGTIAERIYVDWATPTTFQVSGSISGNLGTGTVGALFANKVQFVATAGTVPWVAGERATIDVKRQGYRNSQVPRSLMKQPGGKLILIGSPPAVTATKLNDHSTAGASVFTLADLVNWAQGDQIVVGPSDYFGVAGGTSDKLAVQGMAGNSLMTATALAAARWGKLQYATDAGMSLSAGAWTNSAGIPSGDFAQIPTVVDERAPVVILTRNIVFQGADDAAWANNQFGLHCMFMGLAGDVKIDGVEFRRVGQAGAIGCYPIHWHMMSWNMPDGMGLPSDGTYLGQTTGQYIKNSSIHMSGQRAVVLHGTDGVLVENNVVYDVVGHAIFFEDASERYNIVRGNTVMKVRFPTADNRLVNHDQYVYQGGTAGLWFTNPTNRILNNRFADCEGVSIWNSFPIRPHGLSMEANIPSPLYTPLLEYSGNVCHSSKYGGMATQNPLFDEFGNFGSNPEFWSLGLDKWIPTSNGLPYDGTNQIDIAMLTMGIYKCREGAYFNRVGQSAYDGWWTADNEGLDYQGATIAGAFGNHLLAVGTSLNNANTPASINASNGGVNPRSAFATYHETLNFRNCAVVNFPLIAPVSPGADRAEIGGGMFRFNDLYLQSKFTFKRSSGNKLVGSNVGYRSRPPHIDGQALNNRNFTFAGALRDVTGLLTGTAGLHRIYNDAFLTAGAANLADVDGYDKKTTSRYFGWDAVWSDTSDATLAGANRYYIVTPHYYTRLDPANDAVLGQWNVGLGSLSPFFGNMRHASVANGGKYKLAYPGYSAPRSFSQWQLLDANNSGDTVVLGFPWAGDVPLKGWCVAVPDSNWPPTDARLASGVARAITAAASYAAMVAGSGDKVWLDTANNMAWVKHVGGMPYDLAGAATDTDVDILRPVQYRFVPA